MADKQATEHSEQKASSTAATAGQGRSKNLPDVAAKWGVTPKDRPPPYSKPESEYSPEEQEQRAKLRAKGVNPDLKAEIDAARKGNKEGGFWSKVAGTSSGGGWIK